MKIRILTCMALISCLLLTGCVHKVTYTSMVYSKRSTTANFEIKSTKKIVTVGIYGIDGVLRTEITPSKPQREIILPFKTKIGRTLSPGSYVARVKFSDKNQKVFNVTHLKNVVGIETSSRWATVEVPKKKKKK